MSSETRKIWKYVVELSGAMAIYGGALFARKPLLHATPDGPLHMLILLSPVAGIVLAAVAIFRLYLRMDEYGRLQFLKMIAICSAVAACLTSSYGFIKDAFGLHEISIAFAWPVMGACWFVAAMIMA